MNFEMIMFGGKICWFYTNLYIFTNIHFKISLNTGTFFKSTFLGNMNVSYIHLYLQEVVRNNV